MAYIRHISYYLPQDVRTNYDLATMHSGWEADRISGKIGINSRHIAADDETATDMAEKSARKLLSESGISREDIDFLLLCTQSPDYHLPSSACILQARLGLPNTCGAFDFNLGCSGAIYGLAIAKGLISAGIAHNILLLTSETYTKYLHTDDPGNQSIFGDGAAACLISTEGFAEIGEFVLGTDGNGAKDLIVKTGGARHPKATGMHKTDDDGHIWRDDYLYMNGSAIFNFTLENVPPMINDVAERNSISKDQVDYFLFHQANKLILSTLRKLCSIPKEKFYISMESTGNTVSSTVFIGLRDCIDRGIIHSGMNVLCAGFGVGLSWGGTILKF